MGAHSSLFSPECMSLTNLLFYTKVMCSPQYFLPPNSECKVCPDNGNCATIGVTLNTILSAEGAWRNSIGTTDFYNCDNEIYCIGGSALNKTQCLESHKGPLCEVCEDGYKKQGENVTCQICEGSSDSSGITGLMLTFAFVMYVIILLFLFKSLGKFNIIVKSESPAPTKTCLHICETN